MSPETLELISRVVPPLTAVIGLWCAMYLFAWWFTKDN